MNAATLAGARGYPPQLLRELWGHARGQAAGPVPAAADQAVLVGVRGAAHVPAAAGLLEPAELDLCRPTTRRKNTLENLLDWDQIRDPGHMRLIVSASGVEDGGTAYFSNLDPGAPLGPEHVLASGSFPGGFPWTLIRDRAFWDGGLTDNTPLKPVIDNLHGDEPETMPIIMIDVFSSSAPQPANMQQVVARMFEMFLQNKLKADNDTSRSYTRFISVLKQVDQQLPADASVRKDKDWAEVMNYALVRQIRMIDMNKPAEESASDWSPETIARRIRSGYDQTRAALEETPLMA